MEQLAVEEEPGTTHCPRDGGAAHIVGKYGRLHSGHQQSCKLRASGLNCGQLKIKNVNME